MSNYDIAHLQEIVDAGPPLPAVNQCPCVETVFCFRKTGGQVQNTHKDLWMDDILKQYDVPLPAIEKLARVATRVQRSASGVQLRLLRGEVLLNLAHRCRHARLAPHGEASRS